MLFSLPPLILGAALLSAPAVFGLSPSDIPADTPVSQLISSANKYLAAGNPQDALTYFDVAISKDPKNYLTIFKRGAAYLSLGKHSQARHDFDRALGLKPGFEGALIQRAKLKARIGDWDAARKDYEAAGKRGAEEFNELEEAQGAATLAAEAARESKWEDCIAHAGVAILIAGAALDLRKLRARCRFERGEVMEGVSDLQHVLQIDSGSIEPHLQISAMSFYSLGETDKGLSQIRQCLHSDPDSKICMRLMKREKAILKRYKKVRDLMEKRKFDAASKLLVPHGQDAGLIKDIEEDIRGYRQSGYIHEKAPSGLSSTLLDLTCECFVEMNNLKRGQQFCDQALSLNPTSLHGLMAKAQQQLDADEFEDAIRTLNQLEENHGATHKANQMKQKAQMLLRRSKQKDYYKVLGVDRDADEKTIKRAYRQLGKQFHPDKAAAQGLSEEEAQKKMQTINEAYEVLKDPELKARFDRGDDPNSQEPPPFQQGSPFGHGGDGFKFMFNQGPPRGGGFKFQQGGGFQFQQGGFPGGFQFFQ